MAKLTKRQMKEDKFITGLLKSQEYFNQHRNQILIVAVGILVVALVIVLLIANARRGETVAANQFGTANMYIRDFYNILEADQNRDGIPDGNLDTALAALSQAKLGLEEVLSKHGGSESAKFAAFYLGSISFKLGDFQDAEKYYQRFLSKYYIDKGFEAAAKMGLAGCKESLREFETAGKMFLEVAVQYQDFPQRADALNKAAINLARADLKDQALQAFELLEKSEASRTTVSAARQFLYEKHILDPYSVDLK